MSHIVVALLIIFTTISIPLVFILMHRSKLKKKKEKMLLFFSKVGTLHNLSFTDQQVLRDKIIGLDEPERKLLIVEENGEMYNSKIIDLHEVKTCKVKKTYSTIHIGDNKKSTLEQSLNTIELQFDFKNENTPIAFPFYKDSINSVHDMAKLENQSKYWEAILSKILAGQEQRSLKKIPVV
jgi:hypothetical protein